MLNQANAQELAKIARETGARALVGQLRYPGPHAALDALEACPPLWWADRLLWRGLRWFYRMRLRRVAESVQG